MRFSADARRRFGQHEQHLVEHEPGLRLVLDEKARDAKIIGKISVPLGAGRTELFDIEIRYEGLNPFVTPTTYDPTERFPPNQDRHVEDDGKFCMWLPHTEYGDFDQRDGLARHLNRVREFLRLQITCEDRMKRGIAPIWPGPQWGHGNDGYREWVREHVAELTKDQVGRFLVALTNRPSVRHPCPCGSSRRLASCHGPWLRQLQDADKHAEHVVRLELYEIVEGKDAAESLLWEARTRVTADATLAE